MSQNPNQSPPVFPIGTATPGTFVRIVLNNKPNTSYLATVVDLDGDFKPKRIRIQQDLKLGGRVFFPADYKIMEVLKPSEVWD